MVVERHEIAEYLIARAALQRYRNVYRRVRCSHIQYKYAKNASNGGFTRSNTFGAHHAA